MAKNKLQKILKDNGGKRANLIKIDLRCADLSGTDLSKIDLRCADLSGAKLCGTDLRWTDLREANLSEVDLSGADLRWTDLREANLSEVDLSGADLRWTNLSEVKNLYLLPVQDSRGYLWPHAVKCDDGVWRIRVGCRSFTIAEARDHWGASYKGQRRTGNMYLAAIDWLERVIAEDAV